MDDARLVGGLDGPADLHGDEQRPLDGQRPLPADQVAQVDAVDVLHHEEEAPVGGGPAVGDVGDVGVADLRGGLGLQPEPLQQLALAALAVAGNLDGHPLADAGVVPLVDPAHGPFAHQPAHEVAVGQHRPQQRIARRRRSPAVGPGRRAGMLGARRDRAGAGDQDLPLGRPRSAMSLSNSERTNSARASLPASRGHVGGQGGAHLLAGLEAIVGVLGQRPHDRGVQVGRDVRVEAGRAGGCRSSPVRASALGNSCRPVSSSHRIRPAENRSLRWSMVRPRCCSGDM